MSRGVYIPDERSGEIKADALLEPIDERSGKMRLSRKVLMPKPERN